MERWVWIHCWNIILPKPSRRKVLLEKWDEAIRIKFWGEGPPLFSEVPPPSGAFILQGKLLDVRHNLESTLKKMLKNFSEVGSKRWLPNNTEIMWKK